MSHIFFVLELSKHLGNNFSSPFQSIISSNLQLTFYKQNPRLVYLIKHQYIFDSQLRVSLEIRFFFAERESLRRLRQWRKFGGVFFNFAACVPAFALCPCLGRFPHRIKIGSDIKSHSVCDIKGFDLHEWTAVQVLCFRENFAVHNFAACANAEDREFIIRQFQPFKLLGGEVVGNVSVPCVKG